MSCLFSRRQELVYYGRLTYSSKKYQAHCFLFKSCFLITHKKGNLFQDQYTVKVHRQIIKTAHWDYYPILECKHLEVRNDMNDKDKISFFILEKSKFNTQMYHFKGFRGFLF